jgi:hypothetical protein
MGDAATDWLGYHLDGTEPVPMRIRSVLILSGFATLTACGSVLTAPDADLTGLPPGLVAELSVAPSEVPQGGSFDVELRVRNTTPDTVQVITGHGCLVTLQVVQSGRRFPFTGSNFGCRAAITGHRFAPGETRMYRWDMRAELYAQYTGEVDGRPAPKGWYGVVAEFDTRRPDGTKPFVARVLKVD